MKEVLLDTGHVTARFERAVLALLEAVTLTLMAADVNVTSY
jgi:hypothetical protein